MISNQRLKQNFSSAAAKYDARAMFQHMQTARVLDAALMLLPAQAVIADIGCGTGYFASLAYEKRPWWNTIGVDIAPGMCVVAATRCTAIAGDAVALPLTEQSMDAVVSSLCYQWVENHGRAFAELTRVLKPGGLVIIASLGEATLQELRASADEARVPLGLLPMRRMEQVQESLTAAGLEVVLADQRLETAYYPTVSALLNSMRSIGAGNNFVSAKTTPLTPTRWNALVAAYEKQRITEGIPATWDHQFFIVHKA